MDGDGSLPDIFSNCGSCKTPKGKCNAPGHVDGDGGLDIFADCGFYETPNGGAQRNAGDDLDNRDSQFADMFVGGYSSGAQKFQMSGSGAQEKMMSKSGQEESKMCATGAQENDELGSCGFEESPRLRSGFGE